MNKIIGAKVGALLGLLMFVLVGLAQGFFFGAYGTIIILNKLFGTFNPNMLTSTAIIIGGLIGIASAATVAAVVGALAGLLATSFLEVSQRV